MGDIIRAPIRISMITNNATGAIDIGPLVLSIPADSSNKLHRRDMGGSAEPRLAAASGPRAGKAGNIAGGNVANSKKAPQTVARMASVIEIPRHPTGGVDREQSSAESDSTVFTDIQLACETALGVLAPHDETSTSSPEKEKKDKKKMNQSEAPEPKGMSPIRERSLGACAQNEVYQVEQEVELPSEYHKITNREDQLLRRRIERVKQHAIESLKVRGMRNVNQIAAIVDSFTIRSSEAKA